MQICLDLGLLHGQPGCFAMTMNLKLTGGEESPNPAPVSPSSSFFTRALQSPRSERLWLLVVRFPHVRHSVPSEPGAEVRSCAAFV